MQNLTQDDLDSAVRAGLLPPQTATALLRHAAERQRAGHDADDERFRLLTGFNDVFVVVAMAVMLGAIGVLLGRTWGAIAASAGVALGAWLLGEYFVRARRLALPAVVLTLVFAGACAAAGFQALTHDSTPATTERVAAVFQRGLLGSSLGLALGAALFGARFRAPIAAATLALGLAGAALSAIALAMGWQEVGVGSAIVIGLLMLAAAVTLDATDPQRRTRRSDAAFWLHLVAAPWLVGSLFAALGEAKFDPTAAALLGLSVYLVLSLLALVLDRRALLVSGLVYVLTAVGKLLQGQAVEGALASALAALLIGSALLLLAAFWQRVRAPLVRRLPTHWQALLPA